MIPAVKLGGQVLAKPVLLYIRLVLLLYQEGFPSIQGRFRLLMIAVKSFLLNFVFQMEVLLLGRIDFLHRMLSKPLQKKRYRVQKLLQIR
ncbi:hypothetical protein VN24_02185 [Paenibacillus beijingensis]|uniref:Uncharacterized protein n=1 Tax=Paenibacillus beijingensis TaxID=1126833 RepID=A0A0D5NFH5_9BACL|nr:hypothetical protein VN24_02185 [Paenibacillus beijingensis]